MRPSGSLWSHVLSDPLVAAMMRADGVHPHHLAALLDQVASTLVPVPGCLRSGGPDAGPEDGLGRPDDRPGGPSAACVDPEPRWSADGAGAACPPSLAAIGCKLPGSLLFGEARP